VGQFDVVAASLSVRGRTKWRRPDEIGTGSAASTSNRPATLFCIVSLFCAFCRPFSNLLPALSAGARHGSITIGYHYPGPVSRAKTRACWSHLGLDAFRSASHSRESGNPVHRLRISEGLRIGLAGMTGTRRFSTEGSHPRSAIRSVRSLPLSS